MRIVFKNDMTLDRESLSRLRDSATVIKHRGQNAPATWSGVWVGKCLKLAGKQTSGKIANNTVCGYEPTEEADLDVVLFEGDHWKWTSGYVAGFECLVVWR